MFLSTLLIFSTVRIVPKPNIPIRTGIIVDTSIKGITISDPTKAIIKLENGIIKKLREETDAAKCEISAAENFLREI